MSYAQPRSIRPGFPGAATSSEQRCLTLRRRGSRRIGMMFAIVVSNLKTREIVSAVGPFETEQEAQTFAADHVDRIAPPTRQLSD
jgi:hypothetical protein